MRKLSNYVLLTLGIDDTIQPHNPITVCVAVNPLDLYESSGGELKDIGTIAKETLERLKSEPGFENSDMFYISGCELRFCSNFKYIELADTEPEFEIGTVKWAKHILKTQPGVKITHRFFDASEYIVGSVDGMVYTEEGYLFEDWLPYSHSHRDGFRMRANEVGFYDGWRLY